MSFENTKARVYLQSDTGLFGTGSHLIERTGGLQGHRVVGFCWRQRVRIRVGQMLAFNFHHLKLFLSISFHHDCGFTDITAAQLITGTTGLLDAALDIRSAWTFARMRSSSHTAGHITAGAFSAIHLTRTERFFFDNTTLNIHRTLTMTCHRLARTR